jgi:outer membrane lipopolysaccharide assembly protein LptE/RlpB
MWKRTPPTSGPLGAEPVGRLSALFVFLVVLSACNYTLRAGAGLPPHVRTLAVIPFENDTDRFELSQEVFEAILRDVPRTFGVQTAGEPYADAVIRGTVRRYSVEAPSFRAAEEGAQVVERQVTVVVDVQVIDRVNNIILWENSSLQARGEFLEASELEETGREIAVGRVVRAIIDGLQSNW